MSILQNIEPCFWIFYVIGQIYIVRKGRVLKIIYVSGHTGQMCIQNCQTVSWPNDVGPNDGLPLKHLLSLFHFAGFLLLRNSAESDLTSSKMMPSQRQWVRSLLTYAVTLWIVLHLVFLNYKMMSLKLSPFEKYQIEIIIKITWAVVRLSW